MVNKSLVVAALWAGMRTRSKWSPGPGIKVQSVVSNDDGDWVVSACGPTSGTCPDCQHQSRSRHGWSYRSLQDLPVQGNEVTVRLQLSRWRCTYRQCRRQTFTDRVPAIASPYARRTTKVAEIIGVLGHSTGGRPGERLMRRLGMPISDDTILRHLKRNASRVDDDPAARIIAIDDWSWRKSWRYGTIIVDLERREVMDILEDRSVASVSRWLKRHPSIEVVSRDRCGLYAQGTREGAPQASQVADRFHLIQNLRLAIEEQMSLSGRATGRALLPDEDIAFDHGNRNLHEPAPETPGRNQLRRAHRQSRKDVFETVHALSKEGLTCSDIARRTGYGRRSITKWLTFDTPPDRRRGHRAELVRQLIASLLRRDGTTPTHLPALNIGLRSVRRERRNAGNQLTRLMAMLEAFSAAAELGMKEHDRILLARQQLDRQASAKSTNSKLTRLVDLVVAKPVVSANLIARELGVTAQGARHLAAQLPLREMTGRGRFRAWGLL